MRHYFSGLESIIKLNTTCSFLGFRGFTSNCLQGFIQNFLCGGVKNISDKVIILVIKFHLGKLHHSSSKVRLNV